MLTAYFMITFSIIICPCSTFLCVTLACLITLMTLTSNTTGRNHGVILDQDTAFHSHVQELTKSSFFQLLKSGIFCLKLIQGWITLM